jgi:hypothetical protein
VSVFSTFGNALFGVPQPSSSPFTDEEQQYQQQAKQYAGREQSDYDSEAGLAAQLQNQISGAQPSVAQTQLQQTLGQDLAASTAMGAGGTGTNAVLARYAALMGQGNQAAAAAQTGAILRAREDAANRQTLAGLYGQMGQRSAGLYGTSANTGLNYGNTAATIDQQNADRDLKTEGAGLQFLSGLGSMYFGKPPMPGGAGGAGPTLSPSGSTSSNAGFWGNPVNSAYRGAYAASQGAGA